MWDVGLLNRECLGASIRAQTARVVVRVVWRNDDRVSARRGVDVLLIRAWLNRACCGFFTGAITKIQCVRAHGFGVAAAVPFGADQARHGVGHWRDNQFGHGRRWQRLGRLDGVGHREGRIAGAGVAAVAFWCDGGGVVACFGKHLVDGAPCAVVGQHVVKSCAVAPHHFAAAYFASPQVDAVKLHLYRLKCRDIQR